MTRTVRIHGHRRHAAGQPQSELALHRAVVAHLRQRGMPGLVWWHTANEATRGRPMPGLGVRAGVSDLILVHDGRVFCLELKTPGGRASEAQLEFLADMERAGAFTALAAGLDSAIRVLESWRLLRGKVS